MFDDDDCDLLDLSRWRAKNRDPPAWIEIEGDNTTNARPLPAGE